jgi:hypothetical protein
MKDAFLFGIILTTVIALGWACLAVSEWVCPSSQREIQADGK